MLADRSISERAGRIETDIILPGTARYELIGFVAQELPVWRDNPDRPSVSSEPKLTDQLCDHLNSAAYYSTTWDYVQFRTEVPDEVKPGRKIDLVPKPCGARLIIGGMRYSHFDTLLPIECKRLPTPKGKDRDECEYVINRHGTTGGIQRFKSGHHGAAHQFGAMIAYIQDKPPSYWTGQVNSWIRNLAAEAGSPWGEDDLLEQLHDDAEIGLCTLNSRHSRHGDLQECELRHLWIKMN